MKYITPVFDKKAILKDFAEYLSSYKSSTGKLNYTRTLMTPPKNTKKPILTITEKAYMKLLALVFNYSSEIGWHGIVYRNENQYTLEDIIIPPQEVTAVTVTTDQQAYEQWLMALDDDTFNNLRYQGHSHVNMSVTPSSVDRTLYESLLQQLDKDDYYVFMIINKSLNMHIEIYDLSQNIVFETADITVQMPTSEILTEAHTMVKTYKPKSVSFKSGKTPQYPKNIIDSDDYYYDDPYKYPISYDRWWDK